VFITSGYCSENGFSVHGGHFFRRRKSVA
jgi:hypothetical protein